MTGSQAQQKKYGTTLLPSLINMIYYSHINEDSRVEKQLLQSSGFSTVVGVAGSGERLLSLMDDEKCMKFHAVDVNEEALFILQLKVAMLEALTVSEYLQFCGHKSINNNCRIKWFNEVKKKLNPACKLYWESNISSIENGILNAGHFEKFLLRIRPIINFFLGRNFQLILSGGSPYAKTFPTRKWKMLLTIFSWKWIYKLWGNNDIAFIGRNTDVRLIAEALKKIIYNREAASCFMTHLIFKGHLLDMKQAHLPPSLQKDVLQRIKQNLMTQKLRIYYHHTDILSFVNTKHPSIKEPVFYSASDILSFENLNYLERLLDNANLTENIIVWRTFLSNRFDQHDLLILSKKYNDLKDHSGNESTRMYQVFSIQNIPVAI